MGMIEREPEVIDSLDSTSTIDALSAKQGKVLNDKIPPVIDNLTSSVTTSALSANQGRNLNLSKCNIAKVSLTSSNSFTCATDTNRPIFIWGYAQGIGITCLTAYRSGGSVSVQNVFTGQSFSNNYLTFTATSDGIQIKTPQTASPSWLNIIGFN